MTTSTVTNSETLPPLIQALLTDPACYDHPVEKVELVETHISWVLLTGVYAYKIKKPVNPGFLDFSTLELRQQDCVEELRLNRRLAADIYLDVVAISGSIDAPRINAPPLLNPPPHDCRDGHGTGMHAGRAQRGGRSRANESLREVQVDEIIEYAVKMRQFPSDATLDRVAERGELGNAQIDALAARLAHFHLFECDKAPANSPWGEPDAIARPVEENFQLLSSRLEDQTECRLLAQLQSGCETEHAHLAPLMKERKKSGRVRECHGDLHLANMAWVDGQLVIFDCLEFSPALRWIDVISEVAFCYMDLLHRQYADLASRFLNAWLEVTGDYQGVALLRYYAVYRALVRAKVAVLRVEQGCSASRAEVTSCLQLAEQLSKAIPSPQPSPEETLSTILSRKRARKRTRKAIVNSCGRGGQTNRCASVMLWITHGLPGSGKTMLSQALLEKRGMIRLRSDVERKRLAGLAALDKSGGDIGEGLYTQQASRRTYQHLADLAEGLLAAGWPVIVDAAFLEREQRDLFRDLARRLGVDFQILDIQADPDILRERVSKRQAVGSDASEADLRVLQHQFASAQPLGADELDVVIRLSAVSGLTELI